MRYKRYPMLIISEIPSSPTTTSHVNGVYASELFHSLRSGTLASERPVFESFCFFLFLIFSFFGGWPSDDRWDQHFISGGMHCKEGSIDLTVNPGGRAMGEMNACWKGLDGCNGTMELDFPLYFCDAYTIVTTSGMPRFSTLFDF